MLVTRQAATRITQHKDLSQIQQVNTSKAVYTPKSPITMSLSLCLVVPSLSFPYIVAGLSYTPSVRRMNL